jgi:hypothetical protein
MYEVNIDPFSDSYLPLGTATDPKTNFAFSFTVTGFEPDIRATPFNLGVPVFVRGVDGFNAAVGDVVILPASEPSTILLLLGAGLAYIMATLKRRTKSTYA